MSNIITKINLKRFLKLIQKKKKKLCFTRNSVNNIEAVYTKNLLQLKKTPQLLYQNNHCSIQYIITIKYTKVNTLITVTNFEGLLYLSASAGQFLKGKKKKISRLIVIKRFLNEVLTYLEVLTKKPTPIALHLKNVDSNKFWVINYLKKKFLIKTIKIFDIYPHNGCRQRKKRRKKARFFAKKISLKNKKKYRKK